MLNKKTILVNTVITVGPGGTTGISWLFGVAREHLGWEKGYMWSLTLLVGQARQLVMVLESSVTLTPRNQCSCWLYLQNVARISLLLTRAVAPTFVRSRIVTLPGTAVAS